LQNCSELNGFVNRPVGTRSAANGRERTRNFVGESCEDRFGRTGNALFGEVLILEFAYFACIRGNRCSRGSAPLPKTSFQADNMRFNELLTLYLYWSQGPLNRSRNQKNPACKIRPRDEAAALRVKEAA
jgi:hypothetical protein